MSPIWISAGPLKRSLTTFFFLKWRSTGLIVNCSVDEELGGWLHPECSGTQLNVQMDVPVLVKTELFLF